MLIYFAGAEGKEDFLFEQGVRDILVSFAYINKVNLDKLKQFDHVFLDSGAFSLMMRESGQEEIDAYMEKYYNWLKDKHHLFHQIAEIDVGDLDKIKAFRQRLFELVGDKLVVVWHTETGLEELKSIATTYKNMAFGGDTGTKSGSEAWEWTVPLGQWVVDLGVHTFGM